MLPRGAYRAVFAIGVGAFGLFFASGFVWEVAGERRAPPIEGEGAVARSLEDHARFASIQPGNPYAFVIWGSALEERGDLNGAIEIYERGLELRPTIGPIHAGLADLYYRKGRFDDAREQVKRAYQRGAPVDDRLMRQLNLEVPR